MDRTIHVSDGVFLDLSRLIRSIQRIGGNQDCFGTACEHCDHLGCQWRCYCLRLPENQNGHLSQDTRRVENDCFQREKK